MFLLQSGRNWIHYDAINQFGCLERLTRSIDIESSAQMSLFANQYVICPAQGETVLSYSIQFQDPRNEVEGVIWTFNGDVVSYEAGELTITEPGEYCVTIYDLNNECPTVKCVTIELGDCMDLDPSFNFVKSVGRTTFTVDVTALETRNCLTHQWWVRDITNSSNPGSWVLEGYFASGVLPNTMFQIGRTYEIMHGVWSDCQTWTSSIRTVSQINRFKNISENEETNLENALYPNPTNGEVFINPEFNFNNYIIMNMLGEIILQGQDRQINLESYESGLYLVRFIDAEGQILHSKKLIKN